MSITPQKIVRVLLVFAVLGAGFGIRKYLVSTKPDAKLKPINEQGELVEFLAAKSASFPIHVEAQGRVIAARELAMQAEVSGRIRWLNSELVPGGLVKENDTLLRIDPRDYTLAAEQQKAALERSSLELRVEESRKLIAEKELELMKNGSGSALARRDPQLRAAQNALKASESALEKANLMIARTVLRSPFNAVVVNEQVEIGQLVGPAAPLGRLVGTDHFWVQVSVPMDRLAWIKIPGVNAKEGEGALAHIRQEVGDSAIVREGRVLRLAGDLDPAGQMARLLIEIDDPMALASHTKAVRGNSSDLPLLLGAFVGVEINAGELNDVVELARRAVHPGPLVYIATTEDTLSSIEVKEVWGEEKTVYVKGLPEGIRVITSRVPLAVPGLKIRPVAEGSQAPEAKAVDQSQKSPPSNSADKEISPTTEKDSATTKKAS